MILQKKIERGHAFPLYHQVFLAIRDDIISGKLPFHAKVTEEELAEAYAVSRVTAGRALQELADEGLVERRRRVGTRVVYHAERDTITVLNDGTGLERESYEDGIGVSQDQHGIVRAGPRLSRTLHVNEGSPLVYVKRSLSHGGDILGMVEYHFRYELFELLQALRSRPVSIISHLRDQGRLASGGTQSISVTAADAALAAALETDLRAPIIRLERVLPDNDNRPIGFTVSHFRGDRYCLSLNNQTPTSTLLD